MKMRIFIYLKLKEPILLLLLSHNMWLLVIISFNDFDRFNHTILRDKKSVFNVSRGMLFKNMV